MIKSLRDFFFSNELSELTAINFLEKLSAVFSADFAQINYETDHLGKFKCSFNFSKLVQPSQDFIFNIKSITEQRKKNKEPQIFTKKQFIEIKDSFECPYKMLILIPLHSSNAPLGFLSFGFIKEVKYDELPFKICGLEMVGAILDLTLKKITKTTSINQKFLLTFSHDLATVQGSKQLLNLIENKVKPFLNFSATTIFLLERNNNILNNFFFDAEMNLQTYPFWQSVSLGKLPVDDNIKQVFTHNLGSSSFDFEELSETRDVAPYLISSKDTTQREGLILNLSVGSELIGNWIFLFNEKQEFGTNKLIILQYIINQITTTILKIKTLEEVQRRDIERETILSINIDLATTKDRKDLLKILHQKLNTLFNFSHHFVAIINDDDFTMISFLQDTESVARFHPRYKSNITSKFPINDQVFNKVLLSKDPLIFDLEAMSVRDAMPDYMVINYESGVRKMIMVNLQVNSIIIGVWVICQLENQNLNKHQVELIKGISNQLSIAVENIRAKEVIESKDAEREFLLRISYEITAIQNREDLIVFFNKTLKSRFVFEDVVIMIFNENQSYSLFTYISEKQDSINTFYENTASFQYPINDPVFHKTMSANGAIVFNLDVLFNEIGAPEYLIKEYEYGLSTKVGVKLRNNNKNIGLVFFNSSKTNIFTEHEMTLLNGISYQISLAVSNILANEEIIRRENERELLLSLSTDLAAVRNTSQLLEVITERLKPVLGFSHILITTLNKDKNTFSEFLLDPNSKSKNHPIYASILDSKHLTNDGIVNKIFSSLEPVSFNLDTLLHQDELPVYLKVNTESGIKQAIGIRFAKDSFAFGALFMFFEHEEILTQEKSGLIMGLGHQISIAVSNILANQEIKKGEEEQSKLLKFSNELASERDLTILSKTLKEQLRALFCIDDFLVTALCEDKQTHKAILYDTNESLTRNADFIRLSENFVSIYDGFFDVILSSEDLAIFENKVPLSKKSLPNYLGELKNNHKKTMVGAVIKLGQEPIGFTLFLCADAKTISNQSHLFKSICSQLAIITSNIIANQKVESQLKEIKSYKEQLEEEKTYLTAEIETIHNYTEIIGESAALKETFKLVSQVSSSNSTVLILGETGTGKELIARALHNNSPRKNKLMVKVNCAALPANLIESELFGHERGSFTGATERRIGKFELANGGTLFLDEIGEMPLDLQVKLLRALQEKEIERVGGKNTIKIDVRIIAATNRDLEKEMQEGRFRSDLFYRINIFPISLSPLRDRLQDIEPLAKHFVNRFSKKAGKSINSISKNVIRDLHNYNWPGNIRELEHLIERSILLTSGNTLKQIQLQRPQQQQQSSFTEDSRFLKTIDENEKEHVLKILKYCKGRIAGEGGAAEILGIPPTTLHSKIKRLAIKKEHFINNS